MAAFKFSVTSDSTRKIPLEALCQDASRAIGIPGSKVEFLNSMSDEDVQNLASHMTHVFTEREPILQVLATAEASHRGRIRRICKQYFAQLAASHITIVLRKADGNIIAAVIAAPWKRRVDMNPSPAGLEAMYELFDRLDTSVATHLAIQHSGDVEMEVKFGGRREDRIFELLFAGIDRNFEGLGFMHNLVWVLFMYAAQQGFEEVIAKATSRSQLLLKRWGFIALAEIRYQDYQYNTSHPFLQIKFPNSAKLMWTKPETFFRKFPKPLSRCARL